MFLVGKNGFLDELNLYIDQMIVFIDLFWSKWVLKARKHGATYWWPSWIFYDEIGICIQKIHWSLNPPYTHQQCYLVFKMTKFEAKNINWWQLWVTTLDFD